MDDLKEPETCDNAHAKNACKIKELRKYCSNHGRSPFVFLGMLRSMKPRSYETCIAPQMLINS